MPSPTAPAAAPGLPDASPDEVLAALRAGLEAHFAGLGETVDLNAPLPPAESQEPVRVPARRSVLASGLAALFGGVAAAAMPSRATSAPAPVPRFVTAAIGAHRAAWAAFQVAPRAEAGQAQDCENEALVALLGVPCGTLGGARAIASHLQWYVDEEGANLAPPDDLFGRIVRARLADLVLALGESVAPAAAPGPSPLLAAIAAHAAANDAANAAALAHSRAFDADDPAAEDLLRLADEACERDDETLKALRALRPQDLGEAAMLARHYATTLEEWEEAGSLGAWLLDGLASALEADA